VIADAKRGDIGSTARAYAEAYLEGDGRRSPTR
jgi:orotidine-5'-phosphate decarboxylase